MPSHRKIRIVSVLALFVCFLIITSWQDLYSENNSPKLYSSDSKKDSSENEDKKKDTEEEEKGTIDDFPKDFSALKEEKDEIKDLYYGITLLGGFEERRPLVGIELFLGYKGTFWGFLLNYPIVAREHATQIENRYKLEKFTWKDSVRPDGYDYLDEISDIIWIIDNAYYEIPLTQSRYSFYLKDLHAWDWGSKYHINDFYLNTNHALQTRKSLQGIYKSKALDVLYLNDDTFDLDFHMFGVNAAPVPGVTHWKNWRIEGIIFADTDPLDYNAIGHLDDKSHYKQYYFGAALGNNLPLYTDINNLYFLDLNFQSYYHQVVRPFELSGGFSYQRNWISVSVYALYVSKLLKTPLLSPYFDVNRINIARGKKSDQKRFFGFENILRFYFADKWSCQVRDRIFVNKYPFIGVGFAYGKEFSDDFTFLFIYYRRNIVNIPYFVSSHNQDAVTRFQIGYLIFSKIGLSLDVFIEPMPDIHAYSQTARTKVDLRTKIIF
jgi:hypothetical protein